MFFCGIWDNTFFFGSRELIGSATDKTNWNPFPKHCNSLIQWAPTPFSITLSRKTKYFTVIAADDNSGGDIIYPQIYGTY